MAEWKQETANFRAQCIAHYIARSIRESFVSEKITEKYNKKDGGKEPKAKTDYNSMLRAMGIEV